MSAAELIGMSLAGLTEAYASRALSPVEVLQTVLDHAEAVNSAINALFCFRPEQAMASAQGSEARWKAGAALGPLDGVPMTVKDSVAMIGWPYFHGIGANRALPPSNYDSPPAIALREAGAVIFAKTTMPDCGLMASGISSLHGVTRNPWGLAWNTGGSSAGAGASVAAGAGYVSVGTDIAGSVRLPAAHCGLAGLKPTHGRVPHLPADTMRMAGPMGRCVDDIARLLTVLTRQDERDTWSLPADGMRYHEHLKRDVKGLKIGVLTDMGFGMKAEAAVRSAVEAAAKLLAGAGAIVEPFTSPLTDDAYAPIDLFLQVRGYLEYASLPPHGDTARDINPYVRAWCLGGAKHSGADLYRALGQIAKMKAAMLAAFEGWDYVIAPTLPVVNFPAEEPGVSREMPLAHTLFTAMFNQTCQPAATVCMAFDSRHLPIGVQVIGHRFDDLGVLQVTKALEDMRSFAMNWPFKPRP
ncbi:MULTISPECIES: amidase [Bradyrhizobium]|jgi:aspartyl-tRNA(Asn)/glutamyl-tRNA(Gln) amidotransferase subunit A|uniref:amidase n=1 Tax=Bradyrhizobium TaxID=374 RepID=UPI000486FFF0|nr:MULTISPECIES: amidase [Bradyrhizobium]MCS3447185.1 amidase/aspartyl-tRNA(Asn)/glutamyl-tRNA(Gln) amidotransferase subunit A [Bradyrhizobium elkanii]MCS3561679.1 amidase/aspartyl-tRNA(Asn)/glutamyl-tRNA(Gln) amidotransferase subunit A [Bradyrhizobium elkanii]MCW2148481.1 amidase/aspartyl-tRNA(Asn)/glutamyl-tRNA(Gln) amidotransferase subunit A [Bradyrhizobium elkanii]MCW2352432.1 amidase/aspartyl-tRNA(Asn)/glutamyl-tRNA(Gln) amidotransferase subunit A [Bradyrhizobium elkanii]MCW2372209.1 amid